MPATTPSAHSERLSVPWWLWPLSLGLGALFSAEIGLGAPGAKTWLSYAIVLPAIAGALWWLGRIKVAVTGDELRVDDARLPVRFIAAAQPLRPEATRALLGVLADPEAFVIQRPWIRGAIKITLDDPADPTPYWVVSTRRPAALVAAITAAGAAITGTPPER
jgi:hypothetical protein